MIFLLTIVIDEVSRSLDCDLCDLRDDGMDLNDVINNSEIVANGGNIDLSEMSIIEKRYYQKLHKYSCSIHYFTSKRYAESRYQVKYTQRVVNSFKDTLLSRIRTIVTCNCLVLICSLRIGNIIILIVTIAYMLVALHIFFERVVNICIL